MTRLTAAGIEHRVEGGETGMRISVAPEDLSQAMQLRPRDEWEEDFDRADKAALQKRYARLLFSIPAGAYLGGALVELLDVDPYYANRVCSVSAIITAFVVDLIGNLWQSRKTR